MRIKLDQKFADMSEQERACVLAWANSHDWAQTKPHWGENDPGQLVVYFTEITMGGEAVELCEAFETFRQLRYAAGY